MRRMVNYMDCVFQVSSTLREFKRTMPEVYHKLIDNAALTILTELGVLTQEVNIDVDKKGNENVGK